MFMNEEWVAAVDDSRKHKRSAFHQTPEDARLDHALEANGFDPEKVRDLNCFALFSQLQHVLYRALQ
jgi:cation diffusion facilitator CzcD-associated flavoprotein CzcO